MNFFLGSIALILALGLCVLAVAAFVLAVIGKRRTRVPFLSAPVPVIEAALDLFNFGDEGTFYDLGCGSGRVVFAVADRNLSITARGIEKSPLPYLLFRCAQFVRPRTNATVHYASFENISVRDATHLFVYLLPGAMPPLFKKLKDELAAGAQVVACDFPFLDATPVEVKNVRYGLKIHTLYRYEF
jgi:SAM-dependent methyltransferase